MKNTICQKIKQALKQFPQKPKLFQCLKENANSSRLTSKNPLSNSLILLGALFILTPFIFAYLFAIPQGDDFDQATKALFPLDALSAFYEMAREYLTWSGRYSYHFSSVLFSSLLGGQYIFGLVCALPALIFYFAAILLNRLAVLFNPYIFATLFVVALYANFSYLYLFYTYMDAFSGLLQWSAYFAYFAILLKFYNHRSRAMYLICLFSGIFVIGLYELSGLAVFWTSMAFLAYSHYHRGRNFLPGSLKLSSFFKSPNPYLRLQFWNSLALAASFLAPGNLARIEIRQIPWDIKLQNILAVPQCWLQLQGDFFLAAGRCRFFASLP